MATYRGRASIIRLAIFGGITALCYLLLFVFEDPIVSMTRRGHWAFVVPIAIAFLISYVHGAFTGGFWDVLGVKARK